MLKSLAKEATISIWLGWWSTRRARRLSKSLRILTFRRLAFIGRRDSKVGRVIWSGRVDAQVIGEGGDDFHMVGLVEYPSRKAFVEIATDPYVQEIGVHRASGLEGQWLLAAIAAPV